MPYTLLLLGILHLLSWVLLFLHMGTSLVMLDNNVFNMDIMTWCKWRIQFKIWLFWLLPRCSLKEIKLYSFNHIELQTSPKRDSFIMSLLNFCIQWPLKTYLISIGLLYGTSDFKMFTNGKTTRNFLKTKNMFPNPIMHFMDNQVIMSTLLPLRFNVGLCHFWLRFLFTCHVSNIWHLVNRTFIFYCILTLTLTLSFKVSLDFRM
jgi:hypothetical protein